MPSPADLAWILLACGPADGGPMPNRRVMVVKSGGAAGFAEWRDCFAALDPGLELRSWDEAIKAPEEVDYALLWDPEPGWLARMPRLKVIFGSGAGVDNIPAAPDLPRHLPLVRMSTPEATQRMGEFCCWAVLSL